jgi:LysM repeat protein
VLRGAAVVALVGLAAGAAEARASGSYRVQPGDSLSAIAQAHGTTVGALARLNGLSPAGVLLAGSTLRLPGPTLVLQRYRVQPGDSLTGLAARYGISVSSLARLNRLSATQWLITGSVLRVPVGTAAEAPAAPTAAAAATTTYVVQPGDTLSGIALRYGVSLGELAGLNGLRIDSFLISGARLVVPAHATESFARSSVRESILYWSGHYGVDPHLVAGLAWMESGFNNAMVSETGAVGVMQVEPSTWDYVEQVLLLGRTVPHDADGNVRVGVAYLHHLLRVYGGDERLAVAAYYEGARALTEAGWLPGTKQYVDDVLALKSRF